MPLTYTVEIPQLPALQRAFAQAPAFTGKAVSGGRLDAASALAWTAPAPEPQPVIGPAPQPAPSPAPAKELPAREPSPAAAPRISALRVIERARGCRRACSARRAALAFTASASGAVTLRLERRRCTLTHCRFRAAGRSRRVVTAGPQRISLATLRLSPGRWRATLGGARVAFRVR